MKISEFLSENFQFLVVKFSIYLNRRVFFMHPIRTGLRITRFFKISEKGSVISRKLKNKICTITKTCLYKFDTVKLGFTGVYIIFLISAQKHRLWVLVNTASSRRF